MSHAWTNILLIKPSSLGDIVMALPALSALRRNWPEAQIDWLIRPEFAPLIEGHPHLDEIVPFDRKRLGQAWRDPGAFGALVALIGGLRRRRYDVVLDLQGLFRTASLAWLSGCRQRFGPVWRRELAHYFYTTSVPVRAEWVHVVDYYLKLVETMGGTDLGVEFTLPSKPDAAEAVSELLAREGVERDRYAVLIPGSAQVTKCWPAERFAALADRLASEYDLAIVATGSRAEGTMIEQIQGHAQSRIVSLAGRTSLPELIEVLRRARLVVSNDTGPGHVAAALNRPLVMMFSWSNPLRVGPYGRPECVVARDLAERGLAIRCTNPAHAIANVTLDEVYGKVVEQLSRDER
ncbi:MAG: glycosyltransferase family 9 protein [Sedimentisphaerales bacterium]|nr:glycosyltransferase family 9 protein [Sedimentisphaerales bacterium]